MIKMREDNTYIGDFETLTAATDRIRTNVWGYGLCKVDTLDTTYGTSLNQFMLYVEKKIKSGSYIGFHNLKWDGNFIIHWLINHDFRQITNDKNLIPFSYSALVSDQGQWYLIRVKFANKEVTFFDTLKKLPFKVSEIAKSLGIECKGEIDYTTYRSEGEELSEEDKDYIRRDVQIIATAMKKLFFDNGLTGLTIASDCMSYYKKINKYFSHMFPILSGEEDEFCRKAYRGGYCYVDPRRQEKDLKLKGCTYDYNSMYPSVMHSGSGYYLPVGEPLYYTGQFDKEEMPKYDLYIQRFKASFMVKEGYVPTIQIKKNFLFKDNEYITEAHEPVELYLSSVDLELFFKHYDIFYYEPIDGYAFHGLKGIFDTYINHWYGVKEKATLEDDKVMRMLSKLMLNSLYGRFGQGDNGNYREFITDETDVLKSKVIFSKKKTVYVPIAIFITAYARKELLEAIQVNYENFCYCDTDSIHLIGEKAEGIKIDNSKLGHWKHEGNWDRAKFLRQKTYVERIDGKYEYKCAGMPDKIKEEIDYEDFKIGAEFYGKLTQKNIPGGVVLTETTYKIKDLG